MAVIIRGMKMPENCGKCRVYWEQCGVEKDAVEEGYRVDRERHPDCPLDPVPDHGRVIDADALVKVLKRCSEDEWNKATSPFSWSYAYECVVDIVKGMPTIIPAEKEGEG